MYLKVIRSNVAVINFCQHHLNIVKAPQNIFRAARAGDDDSAAEEDFTYDHEWTGVFFVHIVWHDQFERHLENTEQRLLCGHM